MIGQEKWDLERCILYTIDNSIDIKQSDIAVRDAEVITKMNQQQQLPSVTASTSAFTNFGRTIDPTTNDFVTSTFLSNNLDLNFNWTLYNGGRIKNTIKQGEVNEKVMEAEKESRIASVSLQVIQAYFEALLAGDNYSNAEIQLKTITDQIDQMKKMVEVGSRAQFEIYDLEAQQATSEQQLTLAQNRIDLAMLNLKGIMNAPPDMEMELAEPPIDQRVYTDLDTESFDVIYERVMKVRPEVESLDYGIKSGELQITLAKSTGLPRIGVGGSIGSRYSNQAKTASGFQDQIINSEVLIDGNPSILGVEQTVPTSINNTPYWTQFDNNFSYGFGVSVSMPILDNYNTKGNIERAKINLEDLQYRKEKFIIDTRNLLGQYVTDAKAAKRNLEAADKVLSARQVSFDNAQKRFELGAINSFDYISIQDQLNTARIDQLIAKYDYMMKIKVLDFYQGFPVSLK